MKTKLRKITFVGLDRASMLKESVKFHNHLFNIIT